MNKAVIVTYPGHFFQTRMTIDSIKYFYPDISQIYVAYDDATIEHWPDYLKDCRSFYNSNSNYVPIEFVSFSQINPNIQKCKIGWYRQQLIKCCIDQGIPGDEWFVVDGDVIFDERVDVAGVTPVHHRPERDDPLSKLVLNYIRFALGIGQHPLLADGNYKVTSAIPFRILTRKMLQTLRNRVEQNIGGEFVARHVEMVHAQELIVYSEETDKMVMHEWELIEAVHLLEDPDAYCMVDIGSGYDTMKQISYAMPARFRHGFYKDAELPEMWMEAQFWNFPWEYWTKSKAYYDVLTNRIMTQCL